MINKSHKNPQNRKEAVALGYSADDEAPRVLASGKGLVAERIVEKAKDADVPIYIDPELAHTLNLVSLGNEIPPELYTVVAQVLVYIGEADRILGEQRDGLEAGIK